MEITLIHGQMHKGSTWHASALLRERLAGEDTRIHEFYLPAEGPGFCQGCFQCILKGEEHCPHAGDVQPIVRAMEASGVIIIDSPTYCLEMSGQLKTFFDHLGYMWMSHRPNAAMFQKTAVVISTCAGAESAVRSMARQLQWLGTARVYRIPLRSNASSYQEMPETLKAKMEEEIRKVADRIRSTPARVKPRLRSRLIFTAMGLAQQKGQWNPVDAAYWKDQGWLSGNQPWQ